MTKKKQAQPPIQQGSLFEEDYLIRTLGALVHNPEVALTELVANAWDVGATTVDISIGFAALPMHKAEKYLSGKTITEKW